MNVLFASSVDGKRTVRSQIINSMNKLNLTASFLSVFLSITAGNVFADGARDNNTLIINPKVCTQGDSLVPPSPPAPPVVQCGKCNGANPPVPTTAAITPSLEKHSCKAKALEYFLIFMWRKW